MERDHTPAAAGPSKRTSFTFRLTEPQQAALIELLRTGNFRFMAVPHTRYAAATDDYNVSLYTSGKCLVQGRGAEDFVAFTLEPHILKEVRIGYDEILTPEVFEAHMGVDESGKGDFFGPLVIACAYSDKGLAKTMKDMGVRDSKAITSDKKALDLADQIRKLLGNRFSIVSIGPAAYNRLYAKMRSVNRMLSWGHARAIENLLEKVPDCPKAISDQFGAKHQIERALMGKGRAITLVQRHRAESDVAVAAASVLARAGFLQALRNLAKEHDMPFPKGASAAVQERAHELVRKKGPQILLQVAKCHFKTTDAVLARAGLERGVLGPEGAAVSQSQRPEMDDEES